MASEPTSPLFVRLPAASAEKLSRAASQLREADVLTVEQLAQLLQVDEKTVRSLAAKGDLPDVSRYLTAHYFDPDGLLSDSVKYLRDNGHPDLKVPALP